MYVTCICIMLVRVSMFSMGFFHASFTQCMWVSFGGILYVFVFVGLFVSISVQCSAGPLAVPVCLPARWNASWDRSSGLWGSGAKWIEAGWEDTHTHYFSPLHVHAIHHLFHKLNVKWQQKRNTLTAVYLPEPITSLRCCIDNKHTI